MRAEPGRLPEALPSRSRNNILPGPGIRKELRMASLELEGETIAHMAGAIRDYIGKLRAHQDSTSSAAEKASYQRTIETFEAMLEQLYAQS
jgi:hypothetical protein